MKYHPDKNAGDKEAERIFQQLQEAKEILCNPEKRQMYDKWRNSGLQISYKNWIGMKEHVVSNLILNCQNDCFKLFITFLIYSNNRCTGLIQRPKIECYRRQADQAYNHRELIPQWDERVKAELLYTTGEFCVNKKSFVFFLSCLKILDHKETKLIIWCINLLLHLNFGAD